MRERKRTCRVAMPAGELWDYLADYGNIMKLTDPDSSARLASGVIGEVGARFVARSMWEGVEADYDVWMESADRPRSMLWRSTGYGGQVLARTELARVDETTTDLTLTLHLEPDPEGAHVEPFAWSVLTRLQDTFVDSICGPNG